MSSDADSIISRLEAGGGRLSVDASEVLLERVVGNALDIAVPILLPSARKDGDLSIVDLSDGDGGGISLRTSGTGLHTTIYDIANGRPLGDCGSAVEHADGYWEVYPATLMNDPRWSHYMDLIAKAIADHRDRFEVRALEVLSRNYRSFFVDMNGGETLVAADRLAIDLLSEWNGFPDDSAFVMLREVGMRCLAADIGHLVPAIQELSRVAEDEGRTSLEALQRELPVLVPEMGLVVQGTQHVFTAQVSEDGDRVEVTRRLSMNSPRWKALEVTMVDGTWKVATEDNPGDRFDGWTDFVHAIHDHTGWQHHPSQASTADAEATAPSH